MAEKDIGYLVKSINDKLKLKGDADLKRYNLTLSQSRVFAFLEKNGGRSTQKEIEKFLDVSHPTVVGIVSRMEQNGHIRTYIDEKDKRNKIVELTEQAKTIGASMKNHIAGNEKIMLSSLSDEEIKNLKRMLEIICNNLG